MKRPVRHDRSPIPAGSIVLLWAVAATFATSTASSAQLQLELPHFDVTISRGAPLGIVSLKMKGQQADFADSSGRPLADWELFWLQVFAVDSRPSEPGLFAKLIDPYWPSAEIEERADWRIVRFRRTNVLRAGNTLGLEYWLSLTEPVFEVHYKIENAGRRSLIAPFIMVGLPLREPAVYGAGDDRGELAAAPGRVYGVPLRSHRRRS